MNYIRSGFLTIFIFFQLFSTAQQISTAELKELKGKEDSLRILGERMVQAINEVERLSSDSLFTRVLVRSLVMKNSFFFPFDSVQSISRLYAPDSTFRIFTWQVRNDAFNVRRHGAIQIRTNDGSLKLFPLIDKSPLITSPINYLGGNDNWIGAIYYRIILKSDAGKKYYTLLGYDEHDFSSTIKWIEVLHFNEQGLPVFGGPFFDFSKGPNPIPEQARFWIEYKKDANARIQYDPELDMIMYDHLVPENGETEDKSTYIPDGDYDGFKWEKGKWVHVEKVFRFSLNDGEAPIPFPLKENKFEKNNELAPVKSRQPTKKTKG